MQGQRQSERNLLNGYFLVIPFKKFCPQQWACFCEKNESNLSWKRNQLHFLKPLRHSGHQNFIFGSINEVLRSLVWSFPPQCLTDQKDIQNFKRKSYLNSSGKISPIQKHWIIYFRFNSKKLAESGRGKTKIKRKKQIKVKVNKKSSKIW
jgi:hypothetical protein